MLDAGSNPRAGVVLHYHLQEEPPGELTLSFHDAAGEEIRSFSSVEPEAAGEEGKAEPPRDPVVPAKAGMNRFAWDMRYPGTQPIAGTTDRPSGPLAVPGRYEARLTVADTTHRQAFEIRKDPRIAVTREELQAQFELARRIRDKVSEANDGVSELRSVRRQVEEWAGRAKDGPGAQPVAAAARTLNEGLTAIEEELIEPRADGALNRLNYAVKLIAKLSALTSVVTSADAPPTRQAYEVYDHLAGQIDAQLARLKETLERRLPPFADLLREHHVPAVLPGSEPLSIGSKEASDLSSRSGEAATGN